MFVGEGFHNYHHVFPWDYKTSELGDYSLNLSTAFIDFFAKLGWAYDLKTASKEIIEKRSARTGDGTRKQHNSTSAPQYNAPQEDMEQKSNHLPNNENLIWGWEDPDMDVDDKKCVTIINRIENQQ